MIRTTGLVRLVYVFVLLGFVMMSCKGKKRASMKDEESEQVQVEEFIEFFPEVTLPYAVHDTSLTKKTNDSLLIGLKSFSRFVPDSIFKNQFGAKANPKLYALGRVQEKERENYLMIRANQGTKAAAYILCFDKENNYVNSLPLVQTGKEKYDLNYGALDKKFQITTYRAKKSKDGELQYKRNIYVYNSGAKEFTLILTEPNEEMIEDVYNPFDTLSKKHKLAGDYIKNEKNLVSFRDGKNENELLFFVHFEKDKGSCVGELKGTARMVSAKKAVYKEAGNPCTLEFSFGTNNVTLRELEGCGTYRDIKCFFDGTYPKKKEPSSKKAAKKK